MRRFVVVFTAFIAATTASGNDRFGAPIPSDAPLSKLDAIIKDPQAFSGKEVTTTGVVKKVCKNKGCWMSLESEDAKVRVTFKDYSFFVTQKLKGKQVKIQGTLEVEDTPVDKLRHYKRDEGATAQEALKIKKPQRTIAFVASGVEAI